MCRPCADLCLIYSWTMDSMPCPAACAHARPSSARALRAGEAAPARLQGRRRGGGRRCDARARARAVHTRLDDRGQEGHLPRVPGEGGPARRVPGPAVGDAQPELVRAPLRARAGALARGPNSCAVPSASRSGTPHHLQGAHPITRSCTSSLSGTHARLGAGARSHAPRVWPCRMSRVQRVPLSSARGATRAGECARDCCARANVSPAGR